MILRHKRTRPASALLFRRRLGQPEILTPEYVKIIVVLSASRRIQKAVASKIRFDVLERFLNAWNRAHMNQVLKQEDRKRLFVFSNFICRLREIFLSFPQHVDELVAKTVGRSGY